MPGYPSIYATVGEQLASVDALEGLAQDVRARRHTLALLRGSRENIAAAGNTVRLQYSMPLNGGALFEAPCDLALVWIDREIVAAKGDLRKALLALREYAVKELDAL